MQFTDQEQQIISQALSILESKIISGAALTSPAEATSFLKLQMAGLGHEVFVVVFLNTQHAVIEVEEMFRGTIDAASVFPREVAKRALELNAKAVIFSHNHPSDTAEPSQADIAITNRLQAALDLFEIIVLDHIIVTKSKTVSFAERGLL
jgi:DNA repair protein RadC